MHVTSHHEEGRAKPFGLRTPFAATLLAGDISGASSEKVAFQGKQIHQDTIAVPDVPTVPPDIKSVPNVYVTQA
jgi:hypothetical protein